MKLELLKYYRHARTEEQWDEVAESVGVPAVQVALVSPDGKPMIDQWFVADPFADEVYSGPRSPVVSACGCRVDAGGLRQPAGCGHEEKS